MSTKMIFKVGQGKRCFEEEIVEYVGFPGFEVSQRQKSIISLHSAITKKYPYAKVLEISTKSPLKEGADLSAFNLLIDGKPLECVFQSSKVFEGGEQFEFLIDAEPSEAKHFIRSIDKELTGFRYKDEDFPLVPKSLFYDYIYIKALMQSEKDLSYLKKYNVYTDIEFNEKKQINCQARSVAIFSYMLRNDKLDYYTSSLERFKELYRYQRSKK